MRSRNKGFSLIELMMVVAIIGVLSAIAIPSYTRYVNKAKTVDLMTASNLGQLMVSEYIQSTSATDCTGMLNQAKGQVSVPISSPNISNAYIDAAGTSNVSCAVVVAGILPSGGGVAPKFALNNDVDQMGLVPELQFASYNMLAEASFIPNVQLAALAPTAAGTGAPRLVVLYSIPSFNSDGSISWTLYSNGSLSAPAGLPTYRGGLGTIGGGTIGGTTCDPTVQVCK